VRNIERRINFVYFVAAAALGLSLYAAFMGGSVPTASAQTDLYLSRRVDQVDQRIYSLESRLNRLESTSSRPSIVPQASNTNEVEIQFLRTQLDGLRTRIGELECGVLRLDERTLTAARKQATRSTEPCRQDPAAVIKLSARP
jgi:TolA-binding protein